MADAREAVEFIRERGPGVAETRAGMAVGGGGAEGLGIELAEAGAVNLKRFNSERRS